MLPLLKDFQFREKRVIVRVDINSPLDPSTFDILDTWRLKKIIPTLTELKSQHASQILIAHQGRPGKWDFTNLERHAKALSNLMNDDVHFVNDVYGKQALDIIKEVKKGDIILLDNVRKCKEEIEKKTAEEHAQAPLVKTLAPHADAFVNDAFAAAHRKQCSLLGFIPVLPSFAGKLMEQEIFMIEKLMKEAQRPRVFIFGGGKFENAVEVIGKLLNDSIADKILVGGVPGNAFLAADGQSDMKIDANLVSMLEKFRKKIVVPLDTIDEKDIGPETRGLFKEEINNAGSLFISGPMGVFEEDKYRVGTQEVLKYITSRGVFSLAGGGHTVAAINQLGLESLFTYISTGGGALERMLMGEKLPVIDALIRFKR